VEKYDRARQATEITQMTLTVIPTMPNLYLATHIYVIYLQAHFNAN